jgi:hypothetical protein
MTGHESPRGRNLATLFTEAGVRHRCRARCPSTSGASSCGTPPTTP